MASYMHDRVRVAYACDCPEFWDEIPFKEGRM